MLSRVWLATQKISLFKSINSLLLYSKLFSQCTECRKCGFHYRSNCNRNTFVNHFRYRYVNLIAQTEKIKTEAKLLLEETQKEMENFEEYKQQIIAKAKISTDKLIEKRTKEKSYQGYWQKQYPR